MFEKILIKENHHGKLYCYWDEFANKLCLHIRYWYLDKKDGVEKPTFRGMAIPSYDLQNVLEAMSALLAVKPEEPEQPKSKRKKAQANSEASADEATTDAQAS